MDKRKKVFPILLCLIFGASTFGTMVNSNAKAKQDDDVEVITIGNYVETTVVETTTVAPTTVESITVEETTVEETVKKKKKKKNTNKSVEQTPASSNNVVNVPNNEVVPKATQKAVPKTTKKAKPKTTKKAVEKPTKKVVNNTFPAQYQETSLLGSSKTNMIKNSIKSFVSGTYDNNMQNLAIYLAKIGSSNAQSALNSMCKNTTLKATAKISSITVKSTKQDELGEAADKLGRSLSTGGNKYGVGIKVKFNSGNGSYTIIGVVAVQTN